MPELTEIAPELPQPTSKKRRTRLYIAVVLIVMIAIIVIAVIASNPSLIMPKSKTAQVLIKVEYSGEWQGTYSNQTGFTSWSGFGPKTTTLTRPSQAEGIWNIYVNAQKMDGSGNTLRIMITKTDGTILKEGSTNAPYGIVQIVYSIQD